MMDISNFKRAWILSDCEPLPVDDDPRLMRAGLLAEYLSKKGWKVTWFAPGFDHGKKTDRFDSTEEIEVNSNEKLIALHSPVTYSRNTSPKRVLFYKRLSGELKKYFKKEPLPYVIFCSWPTQTFAKEALEYAKKAGVPVVLDVRDLWPDIFTRVFPKSLQGPAKLALLPSINGAKKLFRQADAITAVTPGALKWGLEKAGRPGGPMDRVIYIGYEDGETSEEGMEQALEAWRTMGITEDTFNFTYFGTFSMSTLDLETVIKAFREIADKRQDVRLLLIGAGDAEQKFREAAGDCDKIVFPGWCSNVQIRSALKLSNVGLYPFRNLEDFRDAFGNKIIGYMAAELPVMSSLEGFSKAYMEQYGTGRTYREGDVSSAKEVMLSFIDDEEENRAMGQRGFQRFKEDFDMQVVNRKLEELFTELIEGIL